MSETLAIERCFGCGAPRVWPRHACPACGDIRTAIAMAGGGAVIHSVTTIHRPPSADAAEAGPYDVALITLDIGGRLMARVPPGLTIGDRVVATRDDPGVMPEIQADRPQTRSG